MGINDLPRGGKFSAVNFQTKLKKAARAGELTNLDNKNQKALVDAIKGYERAVRVGEFSRLRQRSVWQKIKSSDKTITREDRRDIEKVLQHLGGRSAVSIKKTSAVRPPVSVKNQKPAVPLYRRALDTGIERYKYGGAKVGASYTGNEKSIGVPKSLAGISASGARRREKIGMDSLGIKKDAAISAADAGSAVISINKK